jgi:hypothetical protein
MLRSEKFDDDDDDDDDDNNNNNNVFRPSFLGLFFDCSRIDSGSPLSIR